MKRILSVILALVTICCCLIAVPAAMAETASGTNAKMETFTIHSDSSGAFFVLSSSTGLANVAQHNWYGRRTGEGDEKTHGFYDVHVKGPGLDEWMKWAPSATTRKSEVTTCREVRISLPYRGDYTVDVYPMATYQASDYWRVDFIRYWVYNASWHVTILSKCKLKK